MGYFGYKCSEISLNPGSRLIQALFNQIWIFTTGPYPDTSGQQKLRLPGLTGGGFPPSVCQLDPSVTDVLRQFL